MKSELQKLEREYADVRRQMFESLAKEFGVGVENGGGAKREKGPSIKERIISFLREHDGQVFGPSDIGKELDLETNIVSAHLSRLKSEGDVKKKGYGEYYCGELPESEQKETSPAEAGLVL